MEAYSLTQSTGKSTQTCITGSHESQEKVGYDCNNTGKEADRYRGSKVRKLNHLLFIPSKQERSTSLDIHINFIQQFSDAGWRTFGGRWEQVQSVDRPKEENDVSKVPRASLSFLHRVGLQLYLSYTSGTSDS